MRRPRRLLAFAALPLGAAALIACGSQGVEVSTSASNLHQGAEIFSQRCSGCHTLSAAGAEGSAANVRQRERTDGPNFDQRKERNVFDVAYAIRNGGFSGAIMPQNIVVGDDVQKVAQFVVACSGKMASRPESPNAVPNAPPAKACGE
jgi:mono/diheme cytochrome c family protein